MSSKEHFNLGTQVSSVLHTRKIWSNVGNKAHLVALVNPVLEYLKLGKKTTKSNKLAKSNNFETELILE